MKLKTLTLAAALAVLSTGAFAQSAFDSYNAKLNTPAAKEALRKSVCASNVALCDHWAKNGVPDSDVRVGVVATAAVLGAGAGLAAATVPVGALGGNTVLGQWGVTSIAGWGVTAASAGTAGALAGVVTGAAVASR